MVRKGMGKGTGKGYKNMVGVDSRIHSQSAKGIKQPQRIKHFKKVLNQPPMMTAREMFNDRFGRNKPNFMTPDILKYGKLNRNTAYEFSKGKGIIGSGNLYGITLVKVKPDGTTESMFDHSKAFSSKDKAEKYIKELKSLPDFDLDGIPDKYDCDPNDPKEQDDMQVIEIDDFTAGLEERDSGETKVSITERLKSISDKASKKATEKIEEFKEKQKQKRIQEAKAEAKEVRRPKLEEIEKQEKRVKELRYQKEQADEPEEFERLNKELEDEEYQLNERLEKLTEHKIEDYSDAELKTLAVRHKPEESLFSLSEPSNPYKDELLRRIETRKQLNKEINMTKKGTRKKETGLFDGIFEF